VWCGVQASAFEDNDESICSWKIKEILQTCLLAPQVRVEHEIGLINAAETCSEKLGVK
jgi:hypothetical protein